MLDGAARRVPEDARPLRVPKDAITRVLSCERHHVATAAAAGERALNEPVVRGQVLDRLLHHRIHGDVPPIAEEAMRVADEAFLAERDDELLAWLDDPSEGDRRARLAEDATAFATQLASWSPIDEAWWPRCEERVRVPLADGAVVCSARLDVVLGGGPTGRPFVVVEAKSGGFRRDHRDGLLWYALLLALRHRTPPAAVIGWSGFDGRSWCQRVDAGLLHAAADRGAAAITALAEVAAGRIPTATPGPACAWCPVSTTCDVARRPDPDDPDDDLRS